MMNRFKKAEFNDNQNQVELPKSQWEKKFHEKREAVKMGFFGAMTHEEYDWYPAKLLCRRFDVPEPYPGSSQVGCPYIEMLNNKSKNDNEQNNEVQGIFGASMDDLKLFKVRISPKLLLPKIFRFLKKGSSIRLNWSKFRVFKDRAHSRCNG